MSRTARNRIHTGAVLIYHIVLVFYLLVLMLRTLSMTAHGAGYLQAQGERVLPLLRLLMTALLAEKLIRRRAEALPAALLAAAGWIVGEEELLDLCLQEEEKLLTPVLEEEEAAGRRKRPGRK